MKKRLLELLACPKCHGKLKYERNHNELICGKDGLAFPIHKSIPILLVSDARVLATEATVKNR